MSDETRQALALKRRVKEGATEAELAALKILAYCEWRPALDALGWEARGLQVKGEKDPGLQVAYRHHEDRGLLPGRRGTGIRQDVLRWSRRLGDLLVDLYPVATGMTGHWVTVLVTVELIEFVAVEAASQDLDARVRPKLLADQVKAARAWLFESELDVRRNEALKAAHRMHAYSNVDGSLWSMQHLFRYERATGPGRDYVPRFSQQAAEAERVMRDGGRVKQQIVSTLLRELRPGLI